jgi:hypothetical protein
MRYAKLVGVVEGGNTGYRVVVVEDAGHWEDGSECDCCQPVEIESGPYLGDAMLPADVRAARWANDRGIPYRA